MSQYCSECGTANGPQAAHCRRCGHPLGDTLSLAATQALRRCERCGALSDRLAHFCTQCGCSLSASAPWADEATRISQFAAAPPPSTIERGFQRDPGPLPAAATPGAAPLSAKPSQELLPDDWDNERTVLQPTRATPGPAREDDLPTVILRSAPPADPSGAPAATGGSPHASPTDSAQAPAALPPQWLESPADEAEDPLPPHLPDPPFRPLAEGAAAVTRPLPPGPLAGGMSAEQAEQRLADAFDHTVALPGFLVQAAQPGQAGQAVPPPPEGLTVPTPRERAVAAVAPASTAGAESPALAASGVGEPRQRATGVPVGWLFAGLLSLFLLAAGFAWWWWPGSAIGSAQAGRPSAIPDAPGRTAEPADGARLQPAPALKATAASTPQGTALDVTRAAAAPAAPQASPSLDVPAGPASARVPAATPGAADGRALATPPPSPAARADTATARPRPGADRAARPGREPAPAARGAAPTAASEPIAAALPTPAAPPATAVPPAAPPPAAPAAPPPTVSQACASAGGFLAQQMCRYRACEKAEHSRDAICVEMRRTEERNRGTDGG